jgi:flagellar biosynthesis protein FliQ
LHSGSNHRPLFFTVAVNLHFWSEKQSKENEDFTKLVYSAGKLVAHRHLERLRSLALGLHIILLSSVHYRTHIFIPENILVCHVVIILPSYMGLKINDHIYNSLFLYVILSRMNIIYIPTIYLKHFLKYNLPSINMIVSIPLCQ